MRAIGTHQGSALDPRRLRPAAILHAIRSACKSEWCYASRANARAYFDAIYGGVPAPLLYMGAELPRPCTLSAAVTAVTAVLCVQ